MSQHFPNVYEPYEVVFAADVSDAAHACREPGEGTDGGVACRRADEPLTSDVHVGGWVI